MRSTADGTTTLVALGLAPLLLAIARNHRVTERRERETGRMLRNAKDARTEEIVVGWRAWNIGKNLTGKARLVSLVSQTVWKPGVPMRGAPHTPPFAGGVHAFKTRADILRYMRHPIMGLGPGWVYGTVALWGNTIEHELGYRAEYGYPLTIQRRPRSRIPLAPLAREYGCEIDDTPENDAKHNTQPGTTGTTRESAGITPGKTIQPRNENNDAEDLEAPVRFTRIGRLVFLTLAFGLALCLTEAGSMISEFLDRAQPDIDKTA